MEQAIAVLLLASIAAGVGAVVALARRRGGARDRALSDLADRLGWVYEADPPEEGGVFRLHGQTPSGDGWTLTARRHGSGARRHVETRWCAAVSRSPAAAAVIVGPTFDGVDPDAREAPRVERLVRAFIGPDAPELADLREVEVGPDGFRARFHVLATSADLAEQFVSGPTVMALQDWAVGGREPPIVLYWRPGLEVRVRRIEDDPTELIRMVELGLMLHTTVLPG